MMTKNRRKISHTVLPPPPAAGGATAAGAPTPLRTSQTPLLSTAVLSTPLLPPQQQQQHSILDTLPTETMIPSLLILLLTSVCLTATNAIFNYFAQNNRSVAETFRQWSRVLWMSKAAHIVEAPSPAQAHRLAQDRHNVAVSSQTGLAVMSPVKLYDSAAFFRGIASPSIVPMEETYLLESVPHTHAHSDVHPRLRTPAPSPLSAVPEMTVYHVENPPASVPAPVVAEALANTMEAIRLESQRLLFRFHPYYIILCSVKACAMLLYIQYHFDATEGGWRRFCVCGAANIFSGLLTPVWEYLNVLLLPLDPDRAQPAVVKVDEEKTDSVFIVELLLRISSLELDDLPTVLTQGSSFVVFSAVLVPLLVTFCIPGTIRYCWMYAPLWLVYAFARHLYYRGAGTLPSSTARNAAAVFGMTSELVKAFLMKMLTLFVILFTVQSSFLLGMTWAEKTSYNEGLQYALHHELSMRGSDYASTFQKLCLLSQLVL